VFKRFAHIMRHDAASHHIACHAPFRPPHLGNKPSLATLTLKYFFTYFI